jgi:LEA14-like dessication related protein
MNKKNIIIASIIGGVGIFAYSIYRYIKIQADLLQKFSYKIIGINFDKFDANLIKGNISVLFTSESDVEVVVKSFYLDFYLNGNRVGYIEEGTEFIVPSRSSTTIPLSFTLNPQLVFTNVVDLIEYTMKTKDASIYISGYAKLKSGFISVTLPIEYNTTLTELLS